MGYLGPLMIFVIRGASGLSSNSCGVGMYEACLCVLLAGLSRSLILRFHASVLGWFSGSNCISSFALHGQSSGRVLLLGALCTSGALFAANGSDV